MRQLQHLENNTNNNWSPNSWKNYPCSQQPIYDNPSLLNAVLEQIQSSQDLVYEDEITYLSKKIALAAEGLGFILQAGDCAESFASAYQENVIKRVDCLFELSKIIEKNLKKEAIIIGRIAGQYAKPRSNSHECIDGITLPCYRGDIINDFVFNAIARRSDPLRLLIANNAAHKTQEYIRIHLCSNRKGKLNNFFVSHEALLLNYEAAQTKISKKTGQFFNTSAHTLWLGERTLNMNGSHVEYLRGIQNPIGIKVGPNIKEEDLVTLIQRINPDTQKGKIMLITRLGVQHVQRILPNIIQLIQKSKQSVLWCSDPMHGNIKKTANAIKTRDFKDILEEFKLTAQIHKQYNSILGGIHLELTPDNVTECIGGPQNLSEKDLEKCYLSYCDPRLNKEQSETLIENILEFLKN